MQDLVLDVKIMKNRINILLPETIMGKLLNSKEVADKLGVSKSFAYKLIQSGEIKSARFRTAVRVREEDLDEYIEFSIQKNMTKNPSPFFKN